ncbi:polysaccharide biosynthesis tyrosine autokinase [Candidatus Saccharibacteria bacterium]|nr:polysaccharide biosynthesis tyrosine autokinase [Candidatus Saccharibacteria bacterium]
MEEINIKEFFSYLKHYIFGYIVAIVLAVGGIVAYDVIIKKPLYQSSTTVVIAKADSTDGTAVNINDVNASQKLANTYSEIAKSELVLNRVIEELDLSMSSKELSKGVTIKPIENTSIINITVKDKNATRSATIANGIAKVFAEEIAKIYRLDNVSQLSVAVTPTAPCNNTLSRDIVLAIAIAVLGVTGFAFLRFYLDDTVKHTDDIEKMLGLPVAGSITKNDTRVKNGNELPVARAPKSIVSENIKSLRTNLQFTAVDRNLKTILVTSANASEGKSFVSANLAVSFAQAGKKVLIIDCDLRKGRLHKLFKTFNNAGLSNLLADNIKNIGSYIRKTTVDNLDLITCGTYPPNPSELLASQRNKKVLAGLRNHYDIIILDGAPVGGLADSVILSSLVDEVLIVTKDGATSKSDLSATRDALKRVDANVAGIVFNNVNHRSSKYYYYYGEEDKK